MASICEYDKNTHTKQVCNRPKMYCMQEEFNNVNHSKTGGPKCMFLNVSSF